MVNTKDIAVHQIRQIVVFTLYFSIFQLLAFHFHLSAAWTCLVFIVLLILSFFEDIEYFDQDSIPETILVLRIWANNLPLLLSTLVLYILERGHFIKIEEEPGEDAPGRPRQMTIQLIYQTGLSVVDDFVIVTSYYIYYFSSFAMFRSLIAQYRFVKRMMGDNLSWSTEEPNVERPIAEPNVEHGEDQADDTGVSEVFMEQVQDLGGPGLHHEHGVHHEHGDNHSRDNNEEDRLN